MRTLKEPKKILLVEDEIDIRDMIQDFLCKNNFTVLSATDGQNALDILQVNVVDLIISDIRMPIKNGFEFISEIRGKGIRIPVILMSGSLPMEQSQLAMLGISAFLSKPLKMMSLLSNINNLLLFNKSA